MKNNDSEGSVASKPVISLIIPTINEAKNLPLVLPYVPLDWVDEVLLVDGRSKDSTIEVAKRLMPSIKVVLEQQPGKGAALRRGYTEAKGDILIVLDADGSNDPREIPRFVQALLAGADLAKGSRFAPSGGTTDMPRLRKLGNWGFVKMVNLLFSQQFSDLCYGFHAFWRHSLDYIDLERISGFEVDTSIYLQAIQNKLKVVDVPSFEGFRFYGKGNLRTFPDGWRVLKTIFREWRSSREIPNDVQQVGFRNHARTLVPVTGDQIDRSLDSEPLSRHSFQSMSLENYFENYFIQNEVAEDRVEFTTALLDVMERVGASSGSIIQFDEYMKAIKGYVVFGRSIECPPLDTAFIHLTEGLISSVARNRQPVLIKNTSNDPRWQLRPWEEKEGVSRSALIVPLIAVDRVVGVLTLTRPEERPFTEGDLMRLKRDAVRA